MKNQPVVVAIAGITVAEVAISYWLFKQGAKTTSWWAAGPGAFLSANLGALVTYAVSKKEKPENPPVPTPRPVALERQDAAPPRGRPAAGSTMIITGSALALLAGVAGLISMAAFNQRLTSASSITGGLGYLMLVAGAVAVLVMRTRRMYLLGLLLGMCWSSASWVAWDLTAAIASHLFGGTGRSLVATVSMASSDLLGFMAAMVLLVAWNAATGRRSLPRFRAAAVVLLCAISCTELAQLFMFMTTTPAVPYYSLDAVQFVAGFFLVWYAMSTRSGIPAFTLLLGWATRKALFLFGVVTSPLSSPDLFTAAFISLACALLAAFVMLVLVYSRRPVTTEVLNWGSPA